MFKGKIKFNFGGAFNLLCLVGVGALAADTIIKLDRWVHDEEQRIVDKKIRDISGDLDNLQGRIDELRKSNAVFKEEEL